MGRTRFLNLKILCAEQMRIRREFNNFFPFLYNHLFDDGKNIFIFQLIEKLCECMVCVIYRYNRFAVCFNFEENFRFIFYICIFTFSSFIRKLIYTFCMYYTSPGTIYNANEFEP